MEFRILGSLEAERDDGPIRLTGPKERALLALLIVNANHVVSTDRIVEEIWGDDATPGTEKTLRSQISRLRSKLGPDVIATNAPGYVLQVEPDAIDAHRFEAAAAAGAHRAALDLWRFEPLEDLRDFEFARVESSRLSQIHDRVVEGDLRSAIEGGQAAGAVGELEHLVADRPLDESYWRLLMTALYRSGRQADALRAYERARQSLADSGLDPAPATRQLADEIAQHRLPDQVARSLPTGTVTFLFTDIVDSTRQWEADPKRMSEQVAGHDRVLREAVESNSGVVVKSTGDGMFAVFARALDGVEAARQAQSLLVTGELRVRFALQTGEADERQGDYFGPALNRAARLVDAAHGGQVLVSQATQHVVVSLLARDASLLDLGEFRLRGVKRSEHIFQFTHPDLPPEFPPIRAGSGAPNNLPPVARTSFVGRTDETQQLARLLDDRRLVTVTGPGGSGKSRTTLELARTMVDRYPDGVWLVELGPVTDREVIPEYIGLQMGEPGSQAADPTAALIDFLRSKTLMLLLDNCEHLLEATAELVDRLLQGVPSLDVLATSREPLSVPGEVVYPLPGLEVPGEDDQETDAVRLFVDRATDAHPAFELDDQNRAAVAAICRQLDGIPLALELAAARMSMMGAPEVATRLEDRLTLLVGGPRTGPSRHQTLRAAIDWSYDLLDEEDQSLMRSLSVFSGGWTIESSTAVVGEGADPLEGLKRLIDKSLVVPDHGESETRYRFLETIRQYASDELAKSGQAAEARLRHTQWFMDLTERLDQLLYGHGQQEAWLRLEVEHDNLRSALQWAIDNRHSEIAYRLTAALAWFWFLRGYWREAGRWYGRCQGLRDEVDELLWARLVWRISFIEVVRQNKEAVRADLGRALEITRERGDEAGEAWVMHFMGHPLPDESDEAAMEQAMATFEKLGDEWAVAWSHRYVGQAVEDTQAGRDHQETALAMFRELGDQSNVAFSLFLFAGTFLVSDVERARAMVAEGLTIAEELDDQVMLAHHTRTLGRLNMLHGDLDLARTRFEEALPTFSLIGDDNCNGLCSMYLGQIAVREGRLDEGKALLARSIKIWAKLGFESYNAMSLIGLSMAASASGEGRAAALYHAAATRFVDEQGIPFPLTIQRDFDDAETAVASTATEEEIASAHAQAKQLSLSEVVDLALGH